MTTATLHRIGMGEGRVSKDARSVLTAPGLGSCVALIFISKSPVIVGMAHVMLPQSLQNGTTPFKFADAAIPLLIQQYEEAGADIRTARIKIGGGAQMFKVAADSPLNIGQRNVEAIRTILSGLGLRIHAEDIGGNVGRTVTHDLSTGRTTVRVVGGTEREL